MQIEIDGITVSVTKKNVKNMNLRISEDLRVTLSVPKLCTYSEISRFLHSKSGWLQKNMKRLKKHSVKLTAHYVTGEDFYLFGEKYSLVVFDSPRYAITIEGDKAILYAPATSDIAHRDKFVNSFYRKKLKEKIDFYLPKWEQLTGLHASSYQIKNMKTRWGTCNTRTKKIWINLRLAKEPVECLWYVLLHELAHTRVYDHGPAFISILDKHMPDWKDIKSKLNKE
ncbi:MAG: M48 family metallopeptidase [Clostridia bacterium]|nr:M48 family metallopeptidase [Clostridia bacterium]